jgi:hypothetical protein
LSEGKGSVSYKYLFAAGSFLSLMILFNTAHPILASCQLTSFQESLNLRRCSTVSKVFLKQVSINITTTKMRFFILGLAALLAMPTAFATPVIRKLRTVSGAEAVSLTAQQILVVAPKSATCPTDGSNDGCRTADQAARWIGKSFTSFSITSKAEQAAVIGLMAFESVEFKYNTNQQGHVGQGTYNMQSGVYNLKYALSIPVLRQPLAQLGMADLNVVRKLVLADEFSFASGAWFLVTQCSAVVRKQLQTGSQESWAQYISQCVGTEPGPREAYWQAAVMALA